MQCNLENLQMYLDGELDTLARQEIEAHLGQCRSCRQEMSRLQLLWLELGKTNEIELPAELPYLRGQIIWQAMGNRPDKQMSEISYWDMQKLAWQPALHGASYLPGLTLFSKVSRAAGRQIPKVMSGSLALAQRLLTSAASQKGENSD